MQIGTRIESEAPGIFREGIIFTDLFEEIECPESPFGPVSKMTIRHYTPKQTGGIVRKAGLHPWSWPVAYEIHYDRQGRVIEWEQHNYPEKWPEGTRSLFRFGHNGQVTRRMKFDSDGNPWTNTICTYDERGLMLELREWIPSGELIRHLVFLHEFEGLPGVTGVRVMDRIDQVTQVACRYDARGRVTEERVGWESNPLAGFRRILRRDKAGRVTEEKLMHNNMGEVNLMKFTYDENGNQVGSTSYGYDGREISAYAYQYDDDGRLSRMENRYPSNRPRSGYNQVPCQFEPQATDFRYDPFGNLVQETRDFGQLGFNGYGQIAYDYEYDDMGNWIRRLERITGYIDQPADDRLVYHVNKPTLLTERRIIYFESE